MKKSVFNKKSLKNYKFTSMEKLSFASPKESRKILPGIVNGAIDNDDFEK